MELTEDQKAEQDPRTKYVLPPDGYVLTKTTRRTICLHCLEPIEMGEDVFWVESDGVFHKDCCVKHPNVQELNVRGPV